MEYINLGYYYYNYYNINYNKVTGFLNLLSYYSKKYLP